MTAVDAHPLSIVDYYRSAAVRQRIHEYCGALAGREPTCVFVTGLIPGSGVQWTESPLQPPARLDSLLDAGADVARSMWDSHNLLFHLDIDYQNEDRPAEALEHPADTFIKLEPVRRTLDHVLHELDMRVLTVMTGHGYHCTARVPLDDPLIDRLANIPPLPAWLATHTARRPPWTRTAINETHGRAYVAIGMLVEYVAQEVIRRAARQSRIPIVVNGIAVGLGSGARQCTSLDFSYAGDPLDVRHMRVAFSAYRTHDAVTAGAEPSVVTVPVTSRTFLDLLEQGRDPEAAAVLAPHSSAQIPLSTRGIGNLLQAYERSPLAAFHRDFYAAAAEPPSRWTQTYDRFDLAAALPCIRAPLAFPNDRLLKPHHLQHVVRYLLSAGWHPRHIAGLVRSRYARDCGWGSCWTRMDPESRADFNVRVFAGLVATGLDRGIDFNCRSAQEKQVCPGDPCTHDLREERDRLIARNPL